MCTALIFSRQITKIRTHFLRCATCVPVVCQIWHTTGTQVAHNWHTISILESINYRVKTKSYVYKMIDMDDTASVCYFGIHLATPRPFYFQYKSSTHLAHIWHKLAHKWHTTSTPYDARHRSRFGRRRCPGRKSYELATPSDLIVWVSNPYPLRYLAFQNF